MDAATKPTTAAAIPAGKTRAPVDIPMPEPWSAGLIAEWKAAGFTGRVPTHQKPRRAPDRVIDVRVIRFVLDGRELGLAGEWFVPGVLFHPMSDPNKGITITFKRGEVVSDEHGYNVYVWNEPRPEDSDSRED